jgi:hypothetical protein
MRLTPRFGSRQARSHPRTPAAPRPTVRLWLERLEDRAVPAFGFGWAFSISGSTGVDTAQSIATDAAGDLYVSGYYSGSIELDPNHTNPTSNHVLTSPLDFVGYAAKYRADGTFLWATDLGPASSVRLAVQGSSVYVAYIDWVGSSANNTTVRAARLSAADGALAWTTPLAAAFNGTYVWDGVYTQVAVGPSGNVYVSGTNAAAQAFAAKLDPAGTVQWTRTTTGGSAQGEAVAVDGAENVYLTGGYTGAVNFGPGAATLTSQSGTQDAFVWRLTAGGSPVWAGSLGSIGDHDFGRGVAVDGGGNVLVTGQWGDFDGSLPANTVSRNNDFDPGTGVLKLTSYGRSDIFVAKLAPQANGSLKLSWAKSIGGTREDWGRTVTADSAGNVYTTGSFIGPVDFNPGPQKATLAGYGGRDIFVSKLDAAGNFVAAAALGGTSNDDGGSIVLDGSSNVYLSSSYRGTADFDPTAGTYALTVAGLPYYFDGAVVKLTQPGALKAFGAPAVAATTPTTSEPGVRPPQWDAVRAPAGDDLLVRLWDIGPRRRKSPLFAEWLATPDGAEA